MTQCAIPDQSQDPADFYGLLHDAAVGYKRFQALQAALQAGVFQETAQACENDALASSLNLDPELTAALCALLAQMGLLERTAKGWRRTSVAESFLDLHSSFYQGEVVCCIQDDLNLWAKLKDILRSGPVDLSREQVFQGSFLDALARESLLGEVQKTMDLVAATPGFRQARTALDLGGGHGLYAIALCQRNPMLEAVIFDRSASKAAAMAYMREFGAGRVTFQAGDLFADDWGREYDLVFFSYNPGGKQINILEKIHRSIAPGGLFVTKHAFYGRQEGSKDALLDLEWLMTCFPGIDKDRHVYRFQDDLSFEEYLAFLKEKYELLSITEAREFSPPALGKFGDRLDSRLIIARKR